MNDSTTGRRRQEMKAALLMNDDKWTRIEYFEDGMSDFVALLLRLEARYPAGWTAPNGEILIVKPYKKYKQEELCEAWKVVSKKRPEWGVAILVAAKEGQWTRVEFLDGFLPRNLPDACWPPIGQAFKDFSHMIVGEFPLLQATPQTGVQATTPTKDAEDKPWEELPDYGYDRRMLEFWWYGHTCAEIAQRFRKSEKTIRNRLSMLRKSYGEEIVPTVKQLRKMQRSR